MIHNGRFYIELPDGDVRKYKYKTRQQHENDLWSFDLWEVIMRDEFDYKTELHQQLERVKSAVQEYPFKRKPMAHQVDMISKALIMRYYAYFAEMGTGKTQAAINTYELLDKKHNINGLIIAPKTVLESWGEEIEKNSNYSYVILNGNKRKKTKDLTKPYKLTILNYETFLSLPEQEYWSKFDMVVLDESSKIKNPKAQRTKLIIQLFSSTSYKLILSGTPITQSPIDIYTQYEFLNKNYIPNKSWYSFRNTYAIMGGYGRYQIVGYRDLDRLKEIISRYSVQIKKEDCIDLPEKIYETRQIEMTAELRKQYSSMKNELLLEINEEENLTATIVLTKLLRLQQILSGKFLKEKNPKLEELKEIVSESIGHGDQVIIWAKFRDTILLLQDAFREHGVSVIYGDIKNRQEQIADFQSGKNKVFIGQIATGGIGITLTAGSVVVYYENDYSLQDRLQSEARAHRIGQRKKVVYIDLIYKGTMEKDIVKALQSKTNVAEYLVESFKK